MLWGGVAAGPGVSGLLDRGLFPGADQELRDAGRQACGCSLLHHEAIVILGGGGKENTE